MGYIFSGCVEIFDNNTGEDFDLNDFDYPYQCKAYFPSIKLSKYASNFVIGFCSYHNKIVNQLKNWTPEDFIVDSTTFDLIGKNSIGYYILDCLQLQQFIEKLKQEEIDTSDLQNILYLMVTYETQSIVNNKVNKLTRFILTIN